MTKDDIKDVIYPAFQALTWEAKENPKFNSTTYLLKRLYELRDEIVDDLVEKQQANEG